VGDRAGVILVHVRDQDGQDVQVCPPHQVLKVRDDIVDSQHVVLREHQAGVDDDGVIAVLDRHHVFADLPQATQGDDP